MQVYLPVAEIPINILLFVGMSALIGFISGLFGVGGGFLITPMLISLGIPAAVAVGSVSGQIAASSLTGTMGNISRRAVDFPIGLILVAGGIFGSSLGVFLFDWLEAVGFSETFTAIGFFILLGTVGTLMMYDSLTAFYHVRFPSQKPKKRKVGQHTWIHGLPLRMRFRTSNLYISVIPIAVAGFAVSLVGALLGIGGSFMLVPVLIYILKVPVRVVAGTSLFMIMISSAIAMLLYSLRLNSVDIILVLVLTFGSAIGTQFGARFGQKLRGDVLRFLFALLVLGVTSVFAFNLFTEPTELFVLQVQGD